MAASNRVWFSALAVVATALTIFGVVFAATDSNPTGVVKDSLVLNGYPPKTADFSLNASSGTSYSVHATVEVNFNANTIEANFTVPLALSGVPLEVRLVDNAVYVSSPNFVSVFGTPWIEVPHTLPNIYNYSLELVRPDIALITGFPRENVTKNGFYVTHDFKRDNVAVTTLGAAKTANPKVGRLNWSITTGKQGEVTQSDLTIASKANDTKLDVTVLSYNQPTRIVAPPESQVTFKSPAFVERLLGSLNGTILVPTNLSHFSSTNLS
jgi:hypothetical protein